MGGVSKCAYVVCRAWMLCACMGTLLTCYVCEILADICLVPIGERCRMCLLLDFSFAFFIYFRRSVTKINPNFNSTFLDCTFLGIFS